MNIIPEKLEINFVKLSKIMMYVSLGFLIISLYAIFFKGINLSIDFKGGTIIDLHVYDKDFDLSFLRDQLINDLNQEVNVVQVNSDSKFSKLILKMEYLSNEDILHDSIKEIFSNYEISKIESIGPKIGDELTGDARNAILASLLLIGLYIAVRFDGSYAAGSIAALIHDVIITLGIFIFINIEISIAVIAAFLTIVGYSLNDTIVIYDRIRENMFQNPHREKDKIINQSLSQTLSRTIVTSFTTLLVVAILFIYGGDVLRPFSLALIIGVIIGTYSSLFVASPIMLFLEKRYNIQIEEN